MDGFVIDTPEGIRMFHFLQVLHALRIETRTGMRMSRGSVLKVAQQVYGVRSRTKAGALAEMEAMLAEIKAAEA